MTVAAVAACPITVSTSAWARPRNPRASRIAAAPAAHGRPTWKPPATISTSLTKSGDGGSPASAPSEMPSDAPSAGCVLPMPPTAWPAARGSWREQRRRGVEAERLRERVTDDVDRDAGERERAAEADPERDHAHVLEARVGEQPLPGLRPPEERAPRRRARRARSRRARRRRCARRSSARAPAATARRRAAPPGRSAAERSAETGRRRLGMRVGQPVVHGRPADLGREARRAAGRRRRPSSRDRATRAGSERHVSVSSPPPPAARLEHEDPEQRHAEAERGEDEVLPARLERPGAAAEADEQRRGGGRRLDREPRGAEVAGERHGEQDGPEGEQRRPVDAVGPVGPEQRAAPLGEVLRRRRARSRARSRRSRRRAARRPGRATSQRPSWRSPGSASATTAITAAAAAVRHGDRRLDAREQARRGVTAAATMPSERRRRARRSRATP